MSELKKQQREQDWGDSLPEPGDEAQIDDGEAAYRDGSAINECWAHEKDNV